MNICHVYMCPSQSVSIGPLGTEITRHCEQPEWGAGNHSGYPEESASTLNHGECHLFVPLSNVVACITELMARFHFPVVLKLGIDFM